MEQESFEDPAAAELLRKGFVAVKVDREERPDIDAVYMQVCQAMTGQGGWPLTLILTPERKAFFAGTYFPRDSRFGRRGLMDILSAVSREWKKNRKAFEESGDKILKILRNLPAPAPAEPERSMVREAFEYFLGEFDEDFGGFGRAPKFPSPHNLMFLFRYGVLESEPRAIAMAEKTLRQMYRGGIFDHVGFGFSRYSTDRKWLVPHFEKMLYDNALLTMAYVEAYQVTGDPLYRRVAEKTLRYAAGEMTGEEGGFFCAQDADSEGTEGKYYVFRPEEIRKLLGEEDGERWNSYFGISREANFEGGSVPNLLGNSGYDREDPSMESLTREVYGYRLARAAPGKDDKVLSGWNALMAAAFANAYQAFGDRAYIEAAEKAMGFMEKRLKSPEGGLMVRYRDGEAQGAGFLDDYAFAAWAYIALYEADFNPAYLRSAAGYARQMRELFLDGEAGGFFLGAKGGESLVLRPKETYDGAMPSGNSAAAYVIARLAKYTAEAEWRELSQMQLSFMAGAFGENPAAHSFGLIAAMQELYPSREIICAAQSMAEAAPLRELVSKRFMPNTAVIIKTPENAGEVEAFAPFAAEYTPREGKAAFYVCEDGVCSAPYTDVRMLAETLYPKV